MSTPALEGWESEVIRLRISGAETYRKHAKVRDGWAVHLSHNRPGYTLTHVRSGFAFGHFSDEKPAMVVAHHVHRSCPEASLETEARRVVAVLLGEKP